MVDVNDLPVIGDTVTGLVTAIVGASTSTDDDGNEVTYARYEVEVQDVVTLDVESEPGQAKADQTGGKEPVSDSERRTVVAETHRADRDQKVERTPGQAKAEQTEKPKAVK